jgi:3,4-dihydroxyphenylacetate 2,3-dioxygenase
MDGSPVFGARADALAALSELERRAIERQVESFVVFDTHWLSNFGYHVNANERHTGAYTSHEAPHMIQNLGYDWMGDPVLGEAIAAKAAARSLNVMPHKVPTLGLEYGTIVPMHYLNRKLQAKVVSVASPLFTTAEESKALGAAVRDAALESGKRVGIIASGSLSHRLWPNRDLGPEAWTRIASEFNRQVDLRVLELWEQRRYHEFLRMLPEYAVKCNGEGGMADTIMLFSALGWESYAGRAEQLCDYFAASGSGQVIVEFHQAA